MSNSHIHTGISFPGRQDIKTILVELERQKKARKDLVIPSNKLEYQVKDASIVMHIGPFKDVTLDVPLSKRAWTQMANWMAIRQGDGLYKWLTQGYQKPGGRRDKGEAHRNWPTWANLMNDFMRIENEQKLVRVMTDSKDFTYCRALLSDKYNIIGNADFFFAIVEALTSTDAEVWCARLSEDRFYGYAVSKGITGSISKERAKDPDGKFAKLWQGAANDTFNAAMVFGNSETGEGGIFMSAAILRSVDKTFQVIQDIVSTAHVGKRLNPLEHLLSDETIKKRNELFFAQITDYVKGAFNPEIFAEFMGDLNSAVLDPIEDPERAADALQFIFPISEAARDAIRNKFIGNHDNTRFGLAGAISQLATSNEMNPDTGFELEKIAAAVIKTDMESIYSKANAAKRDKKAKAAEEKASSDAAFVSDRKGAAELTSYEAGFQ